MSRAFRNPILALSVSAGMAAAPAVMGSPAFAAGNVDRGKKVFAKCKACHKLEAGRKGVGPNLHGVIGRTAGTLKGFRYSRDMKAAGARGLVWTEEALSAYLEKPEPFVGSYIGKKKARTRKAFVGLKKARDRAGLIAYFRARANPNAPVKRAKPSPLLGALKGDPSVIKDLIEAGADPNERDAYDRTPLHKAAASVRNPAVIAALLGAGADPNARDEDGVTPLHAARNPAVVAALLNGGADPNARANDGATPLHSAAAGGAGHSVIALLVKAGASPNARNKAGYTPLHNARFSKNPETASALVKAGADPNAQNRFGSTPLHLAVENRKVAFAALLLASGARPGVADRYGDTAMDEALKGYDSALIALFAKTLKTRPNVRDRRGKTALHRAAGRGASEVAIEALLGIGADPNARDKRGNTPLHVAFQSKKPNLAVALLKGGADPNLKNRDGDRPEDKDRGRIASRMDVRAALAAAGSLGRAYGSEKRKRRKAAERAAREARQAPGSNRSAPSHSSRSSGRSSSSGLFKPDFGLNVLGSIDAQRRARQRQQAERMRRQQEEFRRGEAARRQREFERQRRQAAYERQRERQRTEARRRQEEQRRRQEQARRRQAATAAHAAHCLQVLRLKRGLNVANVRVRNACSFTIEVTGACMGTSFRRNRHNGTYHPRESMGMYQIRPGKSVPAVSEETCNEKGRTARNIACRVPFRPHFTSPTGSSYTCLR